jgi:hypothetical protein
MNSKIISLIIVVLLLTGCSDAPNESALAEIIQSSVREQLTAELSAMSMFGGEKIANSVAKSMGIPDPNTVFVKNVKIDDQTKKENGDYISKVTYVVSVGNEAKKK